MKTVNEIRQVMELVEIVKSALDVNGKIAHDLVKKWMQTDKDVSEGTAEGAKLTLFPSETTLNKVNMDKLAKSAHEILTKNWSDYIAKLESENPVQVKNEFNIKSIPLQLLTKVDNETSNKEIECILSTIKSINPVGYCKYGKEGIELSRVEKLLESKIKENLNEGEYKALDQCVKLLQKVKDSYEAPSLIGTALGYKVK